MPYRYRLLAPDEWWKLDEIAELGPIPENPQQALCIVIEQVPGDEDEEGDPVVIGALFAQPQLHVEPFVVLPGFRQSGVSAHEAFAAMESALTANFTTPLMYHVLVEDQPEVLAIAQGYGLVPFEGHIPHVKVIS